MTNELKTPNTDNGPDRWVLVRDIAVLQVKLVVDGLRDLVLVPISLVAGMISLLRAGDPSGNEFYNLLRVGKKSERWINLFGAAEKVPELAEERIPFPEEDIDALVGRIESFVVDEYRKGGATKQAKERLDRALDSLHKLASRSRKDRHDGE